MTKVNVVLEFDSENLGEQWMNIDNLKTLLYTMNHTGEHLLKVVSYNGLESIIDEMQGECEWKWQHNMYHPSCGANAEQFYIDSISKFTHCPFCGKKIKEAQND